VVPGPASPPVQMQGSTLLAASARRVQQHFNEDIEAELSTQLHDWQEGDFHQRQLLGDPGSVVLGSELVVVLGARMRGAPWRDVVKGAAPDDHRVRGAESAMMLLSSLLGNRRDDTPEADAGSFADESTAALQTLLRQVCICRILRCRSAHFACQSAVCTCDNYRPGPVTQCPVLVKLASSS